MLKDAVDQLLLAAGTPESHPAPKVIIAPHAGYQYSGAVAARAYRELSLPNAITRVVLLGPSHRVAFKGIAATAASHYNTPLGSITIDQTAVQSVLSLPNVGVLDQAHRDEHSLEVHLPFLQRQLGEFQLVPLVVGDASPGDVAAVLDSLWAGPETLVVISTDLSHFLSYEQARSMDRATADCITGLQPSIKPEQACGCRPLNGLLALAKDKGLAVREIDIGNSGDTAGDHSRVVGYGAFAIDAVPAPYQSLEKTMSNTSDQILHTLAKPHQQRLLQVAREAILSPLAGQKNYSVDLQHFPDVLQQQGASFVTLNLNGRLRGCIGSLQAQQQLVLDVAKNAQSAAFRDPRFSPLTLAEYHDTELHISVLSAATPFAVTGIDDLLDRIRPGVDGLIIEEAGKRATYLPSVWEQLPGPEQFVSQLRIKAGLSPDHWSDQTKVWTYTTFEFS